MWNKVYIITGVPGTGKTSVAKELSKLTKLKVFGNEYFGKEVGEGEFGEKIVEIKEVEFKEGIYESHLACETKGKEIFVLRTNPNILEKRLLRRKWPLKKISENIMAELTDYIPIIAKQNYSAIYEIDTSNKSPYEVAKKIINIKKGKEKGEQIDFSEELLKRIKEQAKIREMYHKLYKKHGPQHWWPAETRFEVIVGAILTQNTSWNNVEKAINNLKKIALLDPKRIIETENRVIEQAIKSSGYYRQKTERLKEVSKAYLRFKPSGNIEKDREFWLSIKGIGPETADSILLYAYNIRTFVIDSYTKRLLARYGIYRESYDSYKLLFEEALEDYSIKDFNEYHALIVAEEKNKRKRIKKG